MMWVFILVIHSFLSQGNQKKKKFSNKNIFTKTQKQKSGENHWQWEIVTTITRGVILYSTGGGDGCKVLTRNFFIFQFLIIPKTFVDYF